MIVFPLSNREHAAVRWLGWLMWRVGSAVIAGLLWIACEL